MIKLQKNYDHNSFIINPRLFISFQKPGYDFFTTSACSILIESIFIANAAKDIGYYREVAEQLDCGSALIEAVASQFAEAVKAGRGGQNVSRFLDNVT